jgi:hypothetical protein
MKKDLPKNLFIITSKAITKCLSLFPGFEDIKKKKNNPTNQVTVGWYGDK